jgi:transmembrane sensor
MNESAEYYDGLMARYFSGELAGEELRLLSEWVQSDPGHEEHFRKTGQAWRLIEQEKFRKHTSTDRDWNALAQKLSGERVTEERSLTASFQDQPRRIPLFRITMAAAAVILLLVATASLYLYFSKPAEIVVVASASGTHQMLPDGTDVTLHKGARLSFPEKFGSAKREIKLEGEAYFQVKHDASHPFVVNAGNACVEVLGTQFNLNSANAEGKTEVVLTLGKVAVYFPDQPSGGVVLHPGEKAELSDAGHLINRTANTNPNYMAWKTGVLVFENTTLSEVAAELQHVYGTRIRLNDPELGGCRVTATFSGQSLPSVLEVLKATLGLNLTQNGNEFILSGGNCR